MVSAAAFQQVPADADELVEFEENEAFEDFDEDEALDEDAPCFDLRYSHSAPDDLCPPRAADSSIWWRIGQDWRNFYRRDSLAGLGAGLGVGALLANTSMDAAIHRHFQSGVLGASTDEWFELLHANKEMGNAGYVVPVLATTYFTGTWLQGTSPWLDTASEWSERSMRGYFVGVPHVLAFQSLTGGSRPGETSYDSQWRPFRDDNGVSGHSFVSSLPFITAAMMTDRPAWKASFYAASLLGPLSRVNDNAHYPSQAFLGWWFAYVAAAAVRRTSVNARSWQLMPYLNDHSTGLAVEAHW